MTVQPRTGQPRTGQHGTGRVEAPGTADQRRTQMVVAALEVISERGYADTRIADVAVRAGVSPALVIYYFKTKDQLLTEAIRHYEESWYEVGQRRMEQLPTAAARLEEIVAMNCLTEADPSPGSSWQLWLDFWAQAARNPEVAGVRRKSDERWREQISSIVLAGQEAGEFRDVDSVSFAICLSSLLDGLTIQIALDDPAVDSAGAFEMTMQFVAGRLGFEWDAERARKARGAGVQAEG
ncbi:MAG TPA: TetR family transcriptional regulator C-terminal domain-containing protein [Streptosporangiaceae bacterium]|nr:TetR family transcriptional regulator C-terminal domain-containing protein [Streptosporangiaceae bacterium]